jgi:hypothetical protein
MCLVKGSQVDENNDTGKQVEEAGLLNRMNFACFQKRVVRDVCQELL